MRFGAFATRRKRTFRQAAKARSATVTFGLGPALRGYQAHHFYLVGFRDVPDAMRFMG